MRILHTSDWHLGRTLHGVDLLAHQAAFCDHLVEVVREYRVDAVVVAGDIYDRAIPPLGAVGLLSDVVARLAHHAQIILTPGNHDSAIRLGFGADVMQPGIHLRTRIADVGRPVLLTPRHSGDGPGTLIYPVPYLDPDDARRLLADAGGAPEGSPLLARSHAAVLGAAMRRIGRDLAQRRSADPTVYAVAMAHAFVVGGASSESERDIRVGGIDSVPASVFAGLGLDYVALGHLHGPQAVTVPARECDDGQPASGHPPTPLARYSGSPLAYSFSERHQHKSSAVVDLTAGTVELIDTPVPRQLAEVSGPLAQLLGTTGEAHREHWVRVIVTDPVRPPEMYATVKARFPHALHIVHRPPERAQLERPAVISPARDPLDVTCEFVAHVTGTEPTAREVLVLRSALESVLDAERSA